MRTLPFLWVDVFADRPFAGNPLCVILDGAGLTDAEMQAIARETNLSETTFVLPPTRIGATYRTRIFTPGGELAFAGHPTLGTAAALALAKRVDGCHFVQETISGLTPIDLAYTEGRLDRVIMTAPSPALVTAPDPGQVARVLGLTAADVTAGGVGPEVISAGVNHLVIPIESTETLAAVRPDVDGLVSLSRELGVIGAYCFTLLSAGNETYARARLFAPLYGIPEDPATGSAAAPLGAYMYRHGLLPIGGDPFWYEQGIEMGRPSRIWVDVQETSGGPAIRVGGNVSSLAGGHFNLA